MTKDAWWKRSAIYQIYPRSFQDTDGDGVGDLPGIRERLEHLIWLGCGAVWISPFYPSPMADFGYDVADYQNVDPLFGTMQDFDALIADAHAAGMKVIIDFVPNHTSDQHPWFAESRTSKDSPKRDWYIWRDPAPDGGPPNNWLSNFGGSAWEYDRTTGQYYYHAFLKEQPDLNWRNPDVREAMYDVLRFWMDRGVDGFRVDVLWHLIKDAEFRDNPPNLGWHEGQPEIEHLLQVYSADRPEIHDVVAEMRTVLEEYRERVLIGEIYLPVERLVAYYGDELKGAHLPFNFHLLQSPWNARKIDDLIREYEAALPDGGWPNWVLGNHDQPRIASRVGAAQARVAAMLLLTLRGTPTLYYGDEIGMEQTPIAPGQHRDPWERNEPGLGFSRDPQRTPMRWERGEKAGFTTGDPWLPIDLRDPGRNVATMKEAAGSLLNLYRNLLALRRSRDALSAGDYEPVSAEKDVLAYRREHGHDRLLVVLNLGSDPQALAGNVEGTVLLACHGDRQGERIVGSVELEPDQGLIINLAGG